MHWPWNVAAVLKLLSNGGSFPMQESVPIGVANFSVGVNPEVLKKAGVSMPNDKTWIWDQLAQVVNRARAPAAAPSHPA